MIVELKNDLAIQVSAVSCNALLQTSHIASVKQGTLTSVDQFLNLKLDRIQVLDPARHPHLVRSQRNSVSRMTP